MGISEGHKHSVLGSQSEEGGQKSPARPWVEDEDKEMLGQNPCEWAEFSQAKG